jgi:hypothetical protein
VTANDRTGYDAVALGLLVAAGLLVVLTFQDYGVTWDEPGLRTYGRMLVDWYASGFTDGRAFEFANLRYYGGAFDIVATLLEPLAPFDPFATRHLLGGLIGMIGLVLAWRLARRLGGPRAGLLALALLAILPGWWGHMFFNSKDVPFAVGMLAALAAWIGVLAEWPRPRLRSSVLLGLAVGLTLGIRVGGVLLAAYFALSLFPLLLETRRRSRWPGVAASLGTGALHLLPALPVTVAVLVPAWPWVALAPGHFLDAIAYLGQFPYSADTIFAGQRYPAPAVPLAYWPTLLVLQLPEVFLAGLAAAAASPGLGRTGDRVRRLGVLAVAIAALFPLAYVLLARPTAYNVMRHYIFVLPPLAILAGLGLDRALEALRGRARQVALALVLAGCLLPALRIAQLHPYAYVYFNDLSGGVPAAAGRYELDYWGTSLVELGRMLDGALPAHEPELGLQPVPARICGPFETAQEVMPPSVWPVHHNAPARLAVAIAIFFCVDPPPGAEIARVERLGVPLSRAYRTQTDAVITSFTDRP